MTKCQYPKRFIVVRKEIGGPVSTRFILILHYHEVADFKEMAFVTSIGLKYEEPFWSNIEYSIKERPVHVSSALVFFQHTTEILSRKLKEKGEAKEFIKGVLLRVYKREPRLSAFIWEVYKDLWTHPPKKTPSEYRWGF